MKVATMTLPLHTNYGGIMQAYALQKVIQSLGHETELLYIEPSVFRPPYRVVLSKIKYSLKYLMGRGGAIKNSNNVFSTFIANEIKRTPKIEFNHQLNSDSVQRFDAYIVGSDQVWRPDYAININSYFFDFVNGQKKLLSYAASFGMDGWKYNTSQTQDCTKLASKFSAISVRENAGIALCSDNLNIDAYCNVDPTFLLDLNIYNSLISKYANHNDDSKKIFSYILDISNEKIELINSISKAKGVDYKIFNEGRVGTDKENLGEWLKCFKTAEFIVTDSFHGVVFSILYNKQFIAIGNKDRGLSRFESILNMFGLKERLVSSDDDVTNLLLEKIDYNDINEIIENKKREALEFINTNLLQGK
ncbi:polysaccharide pyruvyl transferase family protein [Vibrio splendidus]|uniref:polysaccharide pyruvyl transferase family protein n=1 Tax=Vibrio splendidus TaxID=29497 RepID=UPI000D3D43BC|nr:polysaccharide pyruvyl transferase family protein [Vibrio splendidus]PTP60929.1 polysaccharide pyruvyl transferase family protein [Vibrio splendidus]